MTQENPSKSNASERFLRLPDVTSKVGLGKSSIYEKVRQGTFPAPVKLSRRAVCWPSSTVDAWMADRMKDSASTPGAAHD